MIFIHNEDRFSLPIFENNQFSFCIRPFFIDNSISTYIYNTQYMRGNYSAIGKPKFQESSDNDSFLSFSKRYQEPTEVTPIDQHLMYENMRNSYYAFQMFCTTRFGWLMCILWVLSFCCPIISVVLFIPYGATIWQNLNILCIDTSRFSGMISGIVVTSIIVVSLVVCMGLLCCGRSRSRKSFALCTFFISVLCFTGPFILVIEYSIFGAPMLIKSSDDIIYDCEFDEGDMDAHLILAWPGQNCEFWPSDRLCYFDLRGFKTSSSIIIVNETSGAYHCQTQDPVGLTHCKACFDRFSPFLYWGILPSILAILFSFASSCAIANQESLKPCTECFSYFPCCKHNACCESVDELLFRDLYYKITCGRM